MSSFFDKFPIILHNLSDNKYSSYQLVRNILFRTAIIQETINNASAYMKYIIHDGDTPEILAAKVYGDPQAHWIILYANEILDPQFDWPMTSEVFSKYIVDKYRSAAEDDRGMALEDYEVIAWTQDTTNIPSYHHYEKVVKQENQNAQLTTEARYLVNKTKLTNNTLDVPHDWYDNLADVQDVTPLNLEVDGQTVIQTIYRNAVTFYDYENELNEARRNIRIIKKDYYTQIVTELNILTNKTSPIFMRRVS